MVNAQYRCSNCACEFEESWSHGITYAGATAKSLGKWEDTPRHPPCPICGSLYYKWLNYYQLFEKIERLDWLQKSSWNYQEIPDGLKRDKWVHRGYPLRNHSKPGTLDQ